jgi:hypothetical protein
MSTSRSAEAEGRSPWSREPRGREDEAWATAPAGARESGVVSISHAERPSWERVGEFLREGKHREQIASFALKNPAFAETLRWMANEAAETDDEEDAPYDSEA